MSKLLQQEMNPYRRFTVILGSSVLLIGIALTLVTLWVSDRFVIWDTVELTKAAVEKHFAKIPQLAKVFDEGAYISIESGSGNSAADRASSSAQMEHQHSDMGYEIPTAAPPNTAVAYETLNALVRSHFDIYSIQLTRFYGPDGRIIFSYDRSEIGQAGGLAHNHDLHSAFQGEGSGKRLAGHLFHLWLPIREDDGTIVGVVEITRDISSQDGIISRFEFGLVAVIVLGMLLMFLALRRVYISSTRTIDEKNKELGNLLQTIERTYDESLQALSSALDSRDNETQGHSFRVTSYAIRLGMELGLDERELAHLARGALLHDVGKIGVPDAILLKPDKLTEEEWVVMKQHVRIGDQMLRHIEFLKPSLDVVLHHHERWDGKGYPNGLAGTDIPFFARVFSICDTYDAMTSDRPYRKGRSYSEARAEIDRCAGTQFCPEVVEAFLRIPEDEIALIQHMSRTKSSEELLERMLTTVTGMRQAG